MGWPARSSVNRHPRSRAEPRSRDLQHRRPREIQSGKDFRPRSHAALRSKELRTRPINRHPAESLPGRSPETGRPPPSSASGTRCHFRRLLLCGAARAGPWPSGPCPARHVQDRPPKQSPPQDKAPEDQATDKHHGASTYQHSCGDAGGVSERPRLRTRGRSRATRQLTSNIRSSGSPIACPTQRDAAASRSPESISGAQAR